LDYMFHGSCSKVSMVLSLSLEPISKSAVHYLAKRASSVKVAREPWYRVAFESIRHDRFGIRNRVERYFRYLS